MSFKASSGARAVIAAALGVAWATGVHAYTLSEAATPAETPPASYAQDVYVDSRGCVYVRASIGTTVNWVPRLSRDRETVVCNLTPSLAAETAPVTPAAPVVVAPAPMGQAAAQAPVAAPTQAPVQPPVPQRSAADATPEVAPVVPATLPTAQPMPYVPPASPATQAAAATVARPVQAAPGDVVRTRDVTCPAAGGSVRVRLGGDTVRLRCPEGLTHATRQIVTHSDGSRSRLVVHPAIASDARSARPGQPVVTPAPLASGHSVRAVASGAGTAGGPAVLPGARWVQVGAFGVSGNATRAVANLKGLGYGAATARTRSGLTVVLAGPFDDTRALQRALMSLRGHYPDAYTRG